MAVNATAIWRVRPSGSNTNGGGYDAGISGAGTDYSQQNSAQASGTHGTTTGTTTFVDATANAFTAAMVGNAVYITGTGQTTGFYFVTAYSSASTVTLDRSPGTGTLATWALGGGWGGAVGTPFVNLTSSGPTVNGNVAYLLGSGTPNPASYTYDYTMTSSPNIATQLIVANDPQTPGYKAWPDTTGGMPVIRQSNGSNSNGISNGTTIFYRGLWGVFESGGGADFFGVDAPMCAQGCVIDQFGQTTYPVYSVSSPASLFGCEIFSSVSASANSDYNQLYAANIVSCNFHDLTGNGLQIQSGVVLGSIIAKCTGTSFAIDVTPGTNSGLLLIANNTIDGNAGSGLKIEGSLTSGEGINIVNNIISNHTGAGAYGLNVASGDSAQLLMIDYNTFYNNTTNYNGISAGAHDTALGTNPYVGQSTENLTLA